jgi:hypothetical protein
MEFLALTLESPYPHNTLNGPEPSACRDEMNSFLSQSRIKPPVIKLAALITELNLLAVAREHCLQLFSEFFLPSEAPNPIVSKPNFLHVMLQKE